MKENKDLTFIVNGWVIIFFSVLVETVSLPWSWFAFCLELHHSEGVYPCQSRWLPGFSFLFRLAGYSETARPAGISKIGNIQYIKGYLIHKRKLVERNIRQSRTRTTMMPTRYACEAQQASQLLGHSGWGIVVAEWSAGGILPLENSSFLCKQELLCLAA